MRTSKRKLRFDCPRVCQGCCSRLVSTSIMSEPITSGQLKMFVSTDPATELVITISPDSLGKKHNFKNRSVRMVLTNYAKLCYDKIQNHSCLLVNSASHIKHYVVSFFLLLCLKCVLPSMQCHAIYCCKHGRFYEYSKY